MSAQSLFKETLTVVNVGLAGLRRRHRRRRRRTASRSSGSRPRKAIGRAAGRSPRSSITRRSKPPTPPRFARFIAANPVLIDVAPARDVLPGMAGGRRLIVHAGPPIAWPQMCGPMRGAMLGAVAARRLGRFGRRCGAPRRGRRGRARALPPPWRGRADGGDHQPVDAGLRRREQGARATARTATSTKGSARCCASAPTGRRSSLACAWMARRSSRRRCAPCSRAPAAIELKPLMAQALNMGDEVHNRNVAATALLHQAHRAGAVRGRRAAPGRRGDARLHRRQRPLLPQPVDGRVQGDAATRRRTSPAARW